MRIVSRVKSGFTLIELMVAMLLMTMVTATCILVFQKSLDAVQKSTGNAEVNQNWRVAMEKINRDLSACLALSSGEQRFQMISRYAYSEEFGRNFPRDYLSFTTSTTITNDSTTAIVSYDITETKSGRAILWRYVQDIGALNDDTQVFREVLCENCPMFRLEYRWQDPRDEDTSNPLPAEPENDGFKHILDPGIFLSLNPLLNEGARGLNTADRFATGGLNGANAVLNPNGDTHSGGSAKDDNVLDDMYASYLIDSAAATGAELEDLGIQIPFRMTLEAEPTPVLEPLNGGMSWVRKRGDDGPELTALSENLPSELVGQSYNRVICIYSPNLWNGSNLDGGDEPLDITANYETFGTDPSGFGQDYTNGGNATPPFGYLEPETNEVRWPTYVPSQLQITVKVHNTSNTSMITRSKIFSIPSAGS